MSSAAVTHHDLTSDSSARTIAPLQLRTLDEVRDVQHWRARAFSPWIQLDCGRAMQELERFAANRVSRRYPGLCLEVREHGKLRGTLLASAFHWDVQNDSLTTFDDYMGKWKRHAFELRHTPANTVSLLEMVIAPEMQGLKLAPLLLGNIIEAARAAGLEFVVGPFRPNRYGAHKLATHTSFSPAHFEAYWRSNDDPWLRTVRKLGVELFKPVARSAMVRRSRGTFERFRRTFKPDAWYEPSPGVWECGETIAWHVTPFTATSVEPNVWGIIRL